MGTASWFSVRPIFITSANSSAFARERLVAEFAHGASRVASVRMTPSLIAVG